jgi:2-keto-4-pentenoate hydratase/2-oxohepta-3-ene-1,7-dioic acid hydratase in catechol pathway
MKLLQYYDNDLIRVGIVEGDAITPMDFNGDMLEYIIRPELKKEPGDPLPLGSVRFAPPISRPSKIIAIGLNYLDHIQESGGKVPDVPVVFAKFPNSLTGHHGNIAWSNTITEKVDFEAELAVVIGKKLRSSDPEHALEAVFGYTCANDVSARDLQFGDGQWVRGKSLDTFCPLGPWIVTRDEISDPHSLSIRCLVNREIMQESNTGNMIFRLPQLLSFLSHHFTLVPGDILLTGTPHGVGAFRSPSVYLKHGDEVTVEIERIGRLVNTCRVL